LACGRGGDAGSINRFLGIGRAREDAEGPT
jgi:hypothetical protein